MKHAIYLLFFLGSSTFGWSQQLTEDISRDVVVVGSPVTIKYVVQTKLTDTLAFAEKLDYLKARFKQGSLSHIEAEFEVLEPFRDTVIVLGMNKKWIGNI